jgi:dihydropteroate synthase
MMKTFKIPALMGILNITEDSFSDGGKFLQLEDALHQAEKLISEGADILDLGAESTRPGSLPVSEEIELQRLIPVLTEIRAKWQEIPISIDTRKSRVAQVAIDLGANIINDISALRFDPEMADVLSAHPQVKVILMHMQGEPQIMQENPHYKDLFGEINAFFEERIADAETKGISRERIYLDPGIGFGKTAEHNFKLLAHLEKFSRHHLPLVIGVSRKRFIASIDNSSVEERLGGTLAAGLVAAFKGAEILRVHNVQAHRQFFQVLKAINEVS